MRGAGILSGPRYKSTAIPYAMHGGNGSTAVEGRNMFQGLYPVIYSQIGRDALRLFFLIIALFISVSAGISSESGTHGSPAPISARFVTDEAIRIDGKLDESHWVNIPPLTGFIQQNPDEGQPATQKTHVRILYSRHSLFVGVRAFDKQAGEIKSLLARRDSVCPSDWIKIWIDSYHDKITAYEFSVNPSGVKRDVHWSNDNQPDESWDAVWEVGVSRDDSGWTAEFRIPFSQLRFSEKDSQTWGFQICRIIARRNETSYWRPIPRGAPRFVSLFGEISGLTGIPSPKKLQLLPYALGQTTLSSPETGNPFRKRADWLGNLGLDMKYGVSSNLTLDATLNPDFGQVEADPAKVNLSAYETYFPEKRPFFIEGKDILDFPLGLGRFGSESLFYSRRIGRPPQGSPSSAEFTQVPQNTAILSAMKLTGKNPRGWSFGFMEALTSRESATLLTWDDETVREPVEPLTNYLLGRVEKEFRDGRSAFGTIMTAVNRKNTADNLSFLWDEGYTGGFDLRHRWAEDRYQITAHWLGSHIRGSKESILGAQTSPARYYQRPGATHFSVDPNRTSLSGYSGLFDLSKIGGRHWLWSVAALVRSPGFEINDMGYMKWADWIFQRSQLTYRELEPGRLFRSWQLSLDISHEWDYSPTYTESRGNLKTEFVFHNYWTLNFGLHGSTEMYQIIALRGGPAVLIPGSWSIDGGLVSDERKNLFFQCSASYRRVNDGAESFTLSSQVDFRPTGNFHISLLPSYSLQGSRLQYVTQTDVDDNTYYVLSRLDRDTFSLTLRINYTITPELSIQLYSQPYVSAGRFSRFKQVVQPLADNYQDRWYLFTDNDLRLEGTDYHVLFQGAEGKSAAFPNPDFNFKQFRLNLVARWEYLPGSIIYLVWSNGFNHEAVQGTFSLMNDLKTLFESSSDNVFLIKFSYWFSL